MIRPTVARVDLSALQHNFQSIRTLADEQHTGHPPAVIAVVKANAYGHGAARVGPALEQAGATMLACADIEEGILLRQSGVRVPILVFGALSVSNPGGIFKYGLTPTVSTPGAARALQDAAAARQATLHCHLKIDTGMNRLGFRHDNLRRTLPEVLDSPNLVFDAVYTHFATADDVESPAMNARARSCANGTPGARFSATPPTAPRSCGIPGAGMTSSGRASCSTASCRHRSGRRSMYGRS
jgi:alanine racemase